MGISIAGLVLLVAAGAGFYFMRHTRSELHAMIGAETLPVPQLETLRAASDEIGNQGGFRKQCEVVGAAHPNPHGPLTSELSKTECVWYEYKVVRQYERTEYRDGRRRTHRSSETVASHTSGDGYALRDQQGTLIGVDPTGTQPDQPDKIVDRFEPYQQQSQSAFGIQLPAMFDSNNTIGYKYEEWAIQPGKQLYILGEVHDKFGPLVIGSPEDGGHYIISTRSEDELRSHRSQRHNMLRIGILVAAPLGLVLALAGLFA